jgi:hypothetical protein
MRGLDPRIHVFAATGYAGLKTWITGSGPVMTELGREPEEKSPAGFCLKLTQRRHVEKSPLTIVVLMGAS